MSNQIDGGQSLLYTDVASKVFKTSNRIIDDIRSTLLLEGGCLAKSTVQYAHERSSKHQLYDLAFLQDQSIVRTHEERVSVTCESNTVSVYRGILLQGDKLCHVKITTKTRPFLEARKGSDINFFYGIEDCDLHEFDVEDLGISSEVLESANFVTKATNKLVRVELSRAELDTSMLSESEIEARFEAARERFEDLPEQKPNVYEVMGTLFKVLKEPLAQSSELRTISANNKTLVSRVDLEFIKTLGFVNDGQEIAPPDLKENPALREKFTKVALELLFMGRTQFHHMEFQMSPTIIFFALGEFKNHWSDHFNNNRECFITLSASNNYAEQTMIDCYEALVMCDPENVAYYYDALREIGEIRGSYRLISYCGKLGIVGVEETKQAYRTLGLDSTIEVGDDVVLAVYQDEIRQHPSKSSTLREALKKLAKARKSESITDFLDTEPLDLHQAYSVLGVDSTVDDDIINTAFSVQVLDSVGSTELQERALLTVAMARKSYPLLTFIEEQYPLMYKCVPEYSCSAAMSVLGINENATDEQCITVFELRFKELRDVRSLRMALHKVASERGSELLINFLRTGVIDPIYLPTQNWPVGLTNIGNTCYLNSLLQYYFTIGPVRDFVLDFSCPLTAELKEKIMTHRIGGRNLDSHEPERGYQFAYQLRDLFHEMVVSKERHVAPTKELAYMSFLPAAHPIEFESRDTQEKAEPKENFQSQDSDGDLIVLDGVDAKDVDGDLISLDEAGTPDTLKPVESPAQPTSKAAKVSPDQMENALEMGRQQDVTESIDNVMFQLQVSAGERFDIQSLFYGTNKVTIRGESTSEQTEVYSNLSIYATAHPRELYDALDKVFDTEVIGDKVKDVKADTLPPILQICVQRVGYDVSRGSITKDQYIFPFYETIYMDRYISTTNPNMVQKREEVLKWKEEMNKLVARKEQLLAKNECGFSLRSSLLTTRDFLQSNVVSSNEISFEEKSIHTIDAYIERIDNEIADINTRLSELDDLVDHQFDAFQNDAYSLFAVFVHRGEASFGHYWVYIRDFENNVWRKYNDESVTEVPHSEVFNFAESNTATPYLMAYVKNDCISEISPLKRDVDT